MQLGTALDVAVGLSFTYFLLAAIVSFIQEFIAGLFKWRGTYLNKAIDVILDNRPEASYAWGGISAWCVAHFTTGAPATQVVAGGVRNDDVVEKLVEDVRTHPLLRNGPNDLPSYMSSGNFATALLTALRDGSSLPVFSQVERKIALLPKGDLQTILLGFVTASAGDLDKLHDAIESWFDTEMDRLSGLYKRASQYMMLILGGVFVLALNINTLNLAKSLWVESPVQRAALMAQANAAVSQSTGAAGFMSNVQTSMGALNSLELPIGWGATPSTPPQPLTGKSVLASIAGWLLTIFAITLGAPFWFDIVQNIVNLRNAGPKPASTTSGG
jgi:hypothetical protein